MRRIKTTIGATCLTVLVAGAVAACGSSSGGSAAAGSDAAAGQVNQAARAKLPDAVRSAGTLKVATSLQWPPFGFKGDGGQPDGFDLDLMKAVSARLGLKTSITDVKFDSIVPSVQNGRFDVGVNELGDIPERRGIVQFVDYYDGGIAVLVPKGEKSDISPTDLCGHTMSLTQGSSQVELGKRISKQCVSEGKPAIDFKMFSDSASTILAVSNGRVEGFMTDYAVGVYLTRTTNKTLSVLPGIVPDSTDRAGIVIAKGNDRLAGALQAALQSMIDDGSYAKILDKWGLSDRAVKKATINDSQSSAT